MKEQQSYTKRVALEIKKRKPKVCILDLSDKEQKEVLDYVHNRRGLYEGKKKAQAVY